MATKEQFCQQYHLHMYHAISLRPNAWHYSPLISHLGHKTNIKTNIKATPKSAHKKWLAHRHCSEITWFGVHFHSPTTPTTSTPTAQFKPKMEQELPKAQARPALSVARGESQKASLSPARLESNKTCKRATRLSTVQHQVHGAHQPH